MGEEKCGGIVFGWERKGEKGGGGIGRAGELSTWATKM